MPDKPAKQKFHALEGKETSRYARLDADLTLADPNVTYAMVTQEMFDALLDDARAEWRQDIVVETGIFPHSDADSIDDMGTIVIERILAELSRARTWNEAGREKATEYLHNLLDIYIVSH
jgi:hypothetical protein